MSSFRCYQTEGDRAKDVGVYRMPDMIPLQPTVSLRHLKSASLIPTRADAVPSKAHDPLDERLTRHLGGRHGHDIAALYAAIPGEPAIQEYVIGIPGVGV